MQNNKHIFALHTNSTLCTKENGPCLIIDEVLWLRITKILRLRPEEDVIIFNQKMSLTLTLNSETFSKKNYISGIIKNSSAIPTQKQNLVLLQSITKKADFEDIIYNAAQLGVSNIIPIKTSKSTDLLFSPKELERFNNIMISACEQAKQFSIPILNQPMTFEKCLELSADIKLVFDSNGTNFSRQLAIVEKASKIIAFFGPEGGLTDQEITKASGAGFLSVKLTPTILRAKDAPLLGLGLLRTLIA